MECIFDGNILRRLREEGGVTQRELARCTKLSGDTISNLELNKDDDPHLSTVIRLADYLDVSIDLFCDRDIYHYADETMKKFIELTNKGIYKKDLIKTSNEVYENQDDEINRKRMAILRKIYVGEDTFINSIFHLICE